jgi:hypothetical protein
VALRLDRELERRISIRQNASRGRQKQVSSLTPRKNRRGFWQLRRCKPGGGQTFWRSVGGIGGLGWIELALGWIGEKKREELAMGEVSETKGVYILV